jgi:thiol-disulfide isomerase/thioredoxin
MLRALIILCLAGWVPAMASTGHPNPGPTGIVFLTDEVLARSQARAEGKRTFIEFYASWCLPCRWMAASTFQDPEVIALMQDHYVPVRADVDRADGFRMFGNYDVTVLPTLIILDENGEVLAREEESLTIVQMLDLLRKHQPDGKFASPRNPVEPPAYTAVPAAALAAPVRKAAIQAAPEPVLPAAPKLPAVPAQGFSVQVGVYTLYANVLSRSEEMGPLGDVPVFVEERAVEQSTIYKLLSGHFATRQEAEAWRARLAAAQVPGYIRDLSR